MTQTTSDYAAIGGATAVREAVDRFYARVLADPDLVGYFDGVDLAQLKRHQALLLTELLGGPAGYRGRDLATAHAKLAITEAHFTKVGAHLLGALGEAGADERVVAAVGERLAAVADQIVTGRP
jgi:hemoglobin